MNTKTMALIATLGALAALPAAAEAQCWKCESSTGMFDGSECTETTDPESFEHCGTNDEEGEPCDLLGYPCGDPTLPDDAEAMLDGSVLPDLDATRLALNGTVTTETGSAAEGVNVTRLSDGTLRATVGCSRAVVARAYPEEIETEKRSRTQRISL